MALERVSKLEASIWSCGGTTTIQLPTLERSFLERAKREATARELLLQAQTELTKLERPQSPVVSVDIRRGAQVCLYGTFVNQTDPNPKRVCCREDFVRGDARVVQGRRGDASGHRCRPSLRSGDHLPTHVFSSTRVAADLPRSEHGEMIRIGPGRDCCRRQWVNSSDDSDFAPLVSRRVASVGILERDSASL